MNKLLYYVFIIVWTFISLSAKEYDFKLKSSSSLIRTGDIIEFVASYKELPDSLNFDVSLLFPVKLDNFERLEEPFNDSKRKCIKVKYTSFAEPNKYFFGPLKVSYGKHSYVTDSLEITVQSFIADKNITILDSSGAKKDLPLDSLSMILPEKDIKEYSLTAAEKKMLLYILGGFIILSVVIFYIVKKIKNRDLSKKDVEVVKEPLRPAHEIALIKLNDLLTREYLQKGFYKEYSVELSYIFREYLENRFKFEAKELPTSDIKIKAQEFISESKYLDKLNSILDVTDLVKYAKHVPLEQEMQGRYNEAKLFIEETKSVQNEEVKKI